MLTIKKIVFCSCIILVFLSYASYSQNKPVHLNKLPIRQTLSVDSGVLCLGGEIHDDGTYESGYGWNNEVYDGRWTIKFKPSMYPWYYTKICLTLSRLEAGPDTFQFKLVAYDTLGAGCPGSCVWYRDTVVTGIGIWPLTSTYQFTGLTIPPLFKGYYWIGIQYDPSIEVNYQKYICADLFDTLGVWPGECFNFYLGTGSWASIVTYDPNYSCLGIRTEGSRSQPGESDCESFVTFTFPPPYWTIDLINGHPWKRGVPGGYGYSAGSALYDMRNILPGINASLVTPIFQPTGTHDSLSFDFAYCRYSYLQDSLIIFSSSDWGSTFNPLVRLGPAELSTTTSDCYSEFTPASGDWKTKTYVLPKKTVKIRFLGKSDGGNDLYLDNICLKRELVAQKNPAEDLPDNYMLYQNYPNPFNPITKISFTLPLMKGGGGMFTKLTIYDILGREVATLVNEQLKPGIYEYEWDGSNFASGIYFYKLETSDFVQTKKMVLIK